jgi:Tfp pilus assembly protein PilV
MRSLRDERGISIIEIMVAIPIIAVALLAVLATLAGGFSTVVASGGQSKATVYARQTIEQLRNQPFTSGPSSGSDTPETSYTRTWTIASAGGVTPNRLARYTVTVRWRSQSGTAQGITVETLRAE